MMSFLPPLFFILNVAVTGLLYSTLPQSISLSITCSFWAWRGSAIISNKPPPNLPEGRNLRMSFKFIFSIFQSSIFQFFNLQPSIYLGTEIHGFIFNKDTAWLRIDTYTALRDYGLLAQSHGVVCLSVVLRRL